MNSKEALKKLKDGNERYTGGGAAGDFSAPIREKTALDGQSPYAVVIACSDSRVVPEAIFSAGIGDLFVIRVAGNVIDKHVLGSVEYAAEHLRCTLAVVLGHTGCGAVAASLEAARDAYLHDSVTADSKSADAGLLDSGTAENKSADAGLHDSGTADSKSADASLHDSDTAENKLSASHLHANYVSSITSDIIKAIGRIADPVEASRTNARAAAQKIRAAFEKSPVPELSDLQVISALYDIKSGVVQWD